MASFNRVILVGNLTRDPRISYTNSGTAVADIGIAVNDKRKMPDGSWKEEVTYVDITLWARWAEIAKENLSKGAPILVEGRLKLDSWESKEGEKRSKLKVIGERMQMLSNRGSGGGGGSSSGSSGYSEYSDSDYDGPSESEMDDSGSEIPF